MLALTENAVTVIRELTGQTEMPDGAGLRIASQPAEDAADQSLASSVTLAITSGPEDGDQVLDADGARLFVEPVAAGLLSDKALDAEVDQAGQVSFQVAEQPTEQ